MNIQVTSDAWSQSGNYSLYDIVEYPEEEIIQFDEQNTIAFVSPNEKLDLRVDNTSAGLFLPNRGKGDYVIIPSGTEVYIKDYLGEEFGQRMLVRDNVYQGANILPLINDEPFTKAFNFNDQTGARLLHKTGYYYSLVDNNSGNSPFSGQYWTKDFSWTPSYGSTVNFKTYNSQTLFGDGYAQILNRGLNSLHMSADLKFEEKDDKEALAIIHFLENHKGVIDFEFSMYEPYNTTNSFLCMNWDHKIGHERSNDISAKFENFNESIYLKWDELFTESPDNWQKFQTYDKFDIATIDNSGRLGHFYATGDIRGVDIDDAPDELNSKWTKGIFFFRPDLGQTIEQKTRTNNSEISDDGFIQPFNDGVNSSIVDLNLTFSNRSEKEARAIIDFLLQRKGYKRFIYSPTTHYSDYKYYICDEWSHTYNFYDNHTISAKFKGLAYKVTQAPRPVDVRGSFKNEGEPLTLEWGTSYNADYYKVYRADNIGMGGEELIATVLDPFYLDTGYVDSTQYYYQIEAINDLGLSPRSYTYTAPFTPPVPDPVSNLTIIFP
jgi:phage-related protein